MTTIELTDEELYTVIDAVQFVEGMASDGVRFYEREMDVGMYNHHAEQMSKYNTLLNKLIGETNEDH